MEGKSSQKQLALIIGASSGVGYELAKQFAENAYDLIIVSENPAIVEAAQACRSLGAEVESCVIDLSHNGGIDELINKIVEFERPVDALAISTGMEISTDTEELTEPEVITSNILSSILLIRFVLKDMIQRKKGRILFTSSVEGRLPDSLQIVYKASKAFMQTYAEGLRQELKGMGITITELFPYANENYFAQSTSDIAALGYQSLMSGVGHVEAATKLKPEELKNSSHKPADPTKLKH